jgi:hypothetical protein
MRGPDLGSRGDSIEVFFGDRAEPLASVGLLAQGEVFDYGLGLAPQLAISGRGRVPRGCGEPVAEEMASQLAGGGLPTPVDPLGLPRLGPEAGLQPVWPNEVFARELEQICSVRLPLSQQIGVEQLYIGEGEGFENGHIGTSALFLLLNRAKKNGMPGRQVAYRGGGLSLRTYFRHAGEKP